MDDFSGIAEFINSLNLGYKFYLGHFTVHHEETVLFVKYKNLNLDFKINPSMSDKH